MTGAPGDTLSTARDSLAGAAGAVHDTLSRAPLPGGISAFFRFLFQVPQWVQIVGAVLAAGVAAWILVLVWRHRAAILGWLRSRSRGLKAGLATGVLAVVVLASFLGVKSWNFMQRDNGFCTGCHIMERPFRRFAAGAGKHENLKCHDCHQQSIFASGRQLVLWVAERPERIGAHAPVPNSRCESCHQVTGGREVFQHVRRLAGHRVHFESDSSALKGVTCVKCHGAEVHKFLPSSRTCQQSGCHEKQPIKLSHMTKLPEISCVTCHAFRADLPGLATRDSAVHALVPARTQCQGCHQMKGKPKGYDIAKDPHKGSCGSCHDVHAHTTPAEATGSCTKCHTNPARSAFHTGANHKRVQSNCLVCHAPHAASTDPSNCVGCHNQVRRRGLFKPPLPFDTAAVLRKKAALGASAPPYQVQPATAAGFRRHYGKGDPPLEAWPPVRASPAAAPPAAPRDSFPHSRHSSLPCLTCHVLNRPSGGLVFQAPRGCDLCHHQAVVAGQVQAKDCARCHRVEVTAAPRPVQMLVRVGTRAPTARSVGFRHDRHEKLACADCHRPPAVAPPDSVQSCTGCHDQHHAAGRDCLQCHNRAETPAAHSRANHRACDDCHTVTRIATLVPARTFCLVCHAKQRDHVPARECSTCHFLQAPAEFKRHLLRRSPG